MIIGFRRIRRERKQFGVKVHNVFAEGSGTAFIAIIYSVTLSLFAIVFGFVLSYETVLLLAIVLFMFSIPLSTSFLSASYTVTTTFVILFVLYYFQLDLVEGYELFSDISSTHFVSLAVIAGIYLIVEAIFISMKRHNFQFVELTKSNRGIWIGRYRLSKLAFIPFLVFLPVAGDG